ncbi:hypothetical protein ACFLT4_02620 [Chloroflexota bacterium]
MLSYKGWRFFNLPLPMKQEDYEEVLEKVVTNLRNSPSVKAAYLAGSDWVPGVSDMDVIVLLDKNGKESQLDSPKSLSEKSSYIFSHNYGAYPYAILKNMFFLNPYTREWRRLFGEEVRIGGYYDLPDIEDQRVVVAATIFDLLVNKLLYFPSILLSKRIDVRKMLGWLWSLTYTLDMLQFTTEEPMAKEYGECIRELRSCWFEMGKQEVLDMLIALMKEANDIILELPIRLGDYLSKKSKWVKPEETEIPFKRLPLAKSCAIPCFMNYKNTLVFTHKTWTLKKYRSYSRRDCQRRRYLARFISQDSYLAFLPRGLSAILYSYALGNGPLSDWIMKDLYANAEEIPILDSVGIRKRITVLNENLDAFRRERVAKVPFPYGFAMQKLTSRQAVKRALNRMINYGIILFS